MRFIFNLSLYNLVTSALTKLRFLPLHLPSKISHISKSAQNPSSQYLFVFIHKLSICCTPQYKYWNRKLFNSFLNITNKCMVNRSYSPGSIWLCRKLPRPSPRVRNMRSNLKFISDTKNINGEYKCVT